MDATGDVLVADPQAFSLAAGPLDREPHIAPRRGIADARAERVMLGQAGLRTLGIRERPAWLGRAEQTIAAQDGHITTIDRRACPQAYPVGAVEQEEFRHRGARAVGSQVVGGHLIGDRRERYPGAIGIGRAPVDTVEREQAQRSGARRSARVRLADRPAGGQGHRRQGRVDHAYLQVMVAEDRAAPGGGRRRGHAERSVHETDCRARCRRLDGQQAGADVADPGRVAVVRPIHPCGAVTGVGDVHAHRRVQRVAADAAHIDRPGGRGQRDRPARPHGQAGQVHDGIADVAVRGQREPHARSLDVADLDMPRPVGHDQRPIGVVGRWRGALTPDPGHGHPCGGSVLGQGCLQLVGRRPAEARPGHVRLATAGAHQHGCGRGEVVRMDTAPGQRPDPGGLGAKSGLRLPDVAPGVQRQGPGHRHRILGAAGHQDVAGGPQRERHVRARVEHRLHREVASGLGEPDRLCPGIEGECACVGGAVIDPARSTVGHPLHPQVAAVGGQVEQRVGQPGLVDDVGAGSGRPVVQGQHAAAAAAAVVEANRQRATGRVAARIRPADTLVRSQREVSRIDERFARTVVAQVPGGLDLEHAGACVHVAGSDSGRRIGVDEGDRLIGLQVGRIDVQHRVAATELEKPRARSTGKAAAHIDILTRGRHGERGREPVVGQTNGPRGAHVERLRAGTQRVAAARAPDTPGRRPQHQAAVRPHQRGTVGIGDVAARGLDPQAAADVDVAALDVPVARRGLVEAQGGQPGRARIEPPAASLPTVLDGLDAAAIEVDARVGLADGQRHRPGPFVRIPPPDRNARAARAYREHPTGGEAHAQWREHFHVCSGLPAADRAAGIEVDARRAIE